MKMEKILMPAIAALLAVSVEAETAIVLPGEPVEKPAIAPDPFPDRMSAYIWRNWLVVPHDRLASVVGASEADLEKAAVEMGLPAKVEVQPQWRRKGYITVLRRNWHLLDYPQLLKVVDMTREELRFSLMEDDFLFVKLGNMKPKCGELLWNAAEMAASRPARLRIGRIVREEGLDFSETEPRFRFVDDLSRPTGRIVSVPADGSPFSFRLIFSYFADYGDPLGDPEIGSFPEGLLEKLSALGVNAVWLHTVLRTLAKDPKYPEFGEGSEKRIANLNTLVKRCAKYGIKVLLYMNEPRAMPDDFFKGHPEREAFRGCDDKSWPVYAMCTSCPEVRRWVRDSLEQVFKNVPGLGGIFTITMSENLTNCASRGNVKNCPRCSKRSTSEIVSEINNAMIEGMLAGNPEAVALVYDWAWDRTDRGKEKVIEGLHRRNVRVLAVSEHAVPFVRGGVRNRVDDYSISVVGPGEAARATWRAARGKGLATAAKIQANCSWELASFPYLPVMDLVAEHAANLLEEKVDGVLLSWSHGCCPAPNLSVYRDIRPGKDAKGAVLDRIASDLYAEAAPTVRKAWTAFSDGYREFPFALGVIYCGPQHMGPANPLYLKPTGYRATMVGIPYDSVKSWRSNYPGEVWSDQMRKVTRGFEEGCRLFEEAIGAMPAEKRAEARRELEMFRAETLHFRSCADQNDFYIAREKDDRKEMHRLALQERDTAKRLMEIVRADSRIGYESSNQYFYLPVDLAEKIVGCRLIADALSAEKPFPPTKVAFYFDTEDYTCDRSNDAIRDIAAILKSEGVKGNFNVVGYLGARLVELGRSDVIEALRHHVIGTQTLYHSRHPDIAELGDNPDYARAYRDTLAEEARGVGMLETAFGEGRVVFACPPGNSVSAVAMDVYSDLGIPVNAATGFSGGASMNGPYGDGLLVRDGFKVAGLWYFNQYHPPYYRLFTLESFLPRKGKPCPDFGKWFDEMAKYDYVGLYMHPHMALKKQHWDAVNYLYGNNCEWRKWKQAEDRDPADTAVYYERLKAFIRAVKADPRFEITDVERMISEFKPRRPITAAEIPAVRAALTREFTSIDDPASWCIADVFQAAVRILRGEKGFDPAKAKVFGFLERPRGVKVETSVTAADMRSAAGKLDLSTFIPAEIAVGGQKLGPADFLFAALELIETGASSVKIVPREQLGSFRKVPTIEKMNISSAWVHTKEFKDRYLSERLRLQLWTLRIE